MLTTKARSDLRSIDRYIRQFNPKAADIFVMELYEKMRSVAHLGVSGTPRVDIGEGIRAIPYRDRIILFRISADRMHVLRILHGRQDLPSDDFPESDIT